MTNEEEKNFMSSKAGSIKAFVDAVNLPEERLAELLKGKTPI